MEERLNYKVLEKIIVENQEKSAVEIAKIYANLFPEILNNIELDTLRRNISWYLDYRKNSDDILYLTKPESAILVISDVHWGRKTYLYEKPDMVDYCIEKAKERIEVMKKGIFKIYSIIQKSYCIDELFVLFLGDIIDGELTFPAQQINIESPEFKQIVDSADTFGVLIDGFANVFPKVVVRAIAGNHAFDRRKHGLNRGDNLLYEMLRREYRKSKKVDFKYFETFFGVVPVKNTNILIYHGYSIKSYLGIPFYGIQRWGSTRLKTLGTDWDLCVLGHFHSYNVLSFSGYQVLINGTMLSSDSYSLEHFGKDGDNLFHFFGIHPERGITFHYNINLKE